MTDNVTRSVVEAFYEAYDSRDPTRIGAVVDDDVEWMVFGPAAVMQVCGQWRGKAAVIERFTRLVPQVIDFKTFERSYLLVDGDESAACGRITSRHRATGRIISHRAAHFVRYRNGKVMSFRAINDTLDAAEQYIGHRIDLNAMPADDDLATV
ncbi:MAG: nuclear transport factor 2 family protein [Pseudolabrys sp.]|nr:nuclear transport factor 2 family protein [Pseudolabrys sp.]